MYIRNSGILLMWQHERLILQNNTSASLFLESALISLNLSIRVIEVRPGTTNLIFNTQDFDDELKKSLNYGYQRVYDTRQYCSLRIYLKSPLGRSYFLKLTTIRSLNLIFETMTSKTGGRLPCKHFSCILRNSIVR